MRIGFIGAGKMGFTLGKHIKEAYKSLPEPGMDNEVIGYYSRSLSSAREAAQFTETEYYESIENLVDYCDTLFITTPDGQIEDVTKELGRIIDGKSKEMILVHTSGALSSQVFSGMGNHVYGYSVHPIYAVNSKTESYVNFSRAYITIEGHERYIDELKKLFSSLGHPVKIIDADNKTKYHGAAVFASNLVVGLYSRAVALLSECGFDREEAGRALLPLFMNNADNLAEKGIKAALTGPVARGDADTVKKHLSVLCGGDREIYRLLSEELINIAGLKAEVHDSMREVLK